MKHITFHTNTGERNTWKYLLQDYLDMKCKLNQSQSEFLITSLEKASLSSDQIKVCKNLSVGGFMVVVDPGKKTKELWLYYPDEHAIKRIPLRNVA